MTRIGPYSEGTGLIKQGGSGGGGAGTITSITSTGLTVTVTNPAGPVTNLEVASPVTASGWEAESLAWAQSITGMSGLNRTIFSDLNDGKVTGIATNNTISTTYNSGAYRISSAGGNSDLTLGNTTTQIFVVSPKTEIWAMRSRLRVTGPFTAGKFVRACSVFDLAANGLEIVGMGSVSGTIFQLRHWYAGGGSTQDFACGAVGTLGAGTCPTNAFITVGMVFDTTNIKVYFGGTLALTLTGAQLTNMVNAAVYPYFGGNDQAAVHVADSIFYACGAS